ncbi:LysM peptidoglycan-binding domain-containing protein [Clostridium ihumii]|uniref:LysM peptidoglycan-binding domain-containing protein n=1 Tax=Clostridium ihumii TaxID=1470356 RepID=UPI003D351C38
MKFKKEIIAMATCVVVLVAVLLTVNFIGKRNSNVAVDKKNNNIVENKQDKKSTKSETKEETKNKQDEKKTSADTEKKQDQNKVTDEKTKSEAKDVTEGIYTVKKNDTLYSIAMAYMPNINHEQVINKIITRNNLKDEKSIVEGQKLIIPYEVALENKTNKNEAKNDNGKNIAGKYEIKTGDSLFSIAKSKMPNVAVNEAVEKIKSANNIKNENLIKVGDIINIPSK